MKIHFLGGAALAALIGSAAHGQAARTLADDAATFGSRPAVSAPALSSDGSKLIYLTPGPGAKTFAAISDLQTGKTNILTSSDGLPESLEWCDFAGADRVVCAVRASVVQVGNIIGFQRQIAMRSDGTDPKLLGQPPSIRDARHRQFDAAVIDWLGGRDGNVLVAREYVPEEGVIGSNIVRKKDGLGVDRVNTANGRSSGVEPPNKIADAYMTDGRGNVRLMRSDETKNDGTLTGRTKYFYRTSGSREWLTLVEHADYDEQIVPLAVDADVNSLYALKKKGGRYALYAIKLDGSLAERLVAENPRVDIDSVIRIGDGQRVIGYTYSDETTHGVYFDPEFQSLAASLSKALPDLPLVEFIDATPDGRKLLIYAGSDTDPGRYYVFDRDAKSLNEAMLVQPKLEGRTLAEVKPVTIPGPDGVQIPAYLTLPAGREASGLPAVVMPHGGPSSRDYWGFDPLVQFLAARGYAVLQPQYRGSAGFGDAWMNGNGFRNWRTSVSDISASARWLASQGIADPDKLAIFGWSYGGYAALLSAQVDPSLYKAVIAVAPVTDLELLKKDSANYTDVRLVEKLVGSGAHVDLGSPLRHAGKITAPVLLAHADMDENVRVWHSEKMEAALKSAGKQVQFLRYEGLDHGLSDSGALTEILTHTGQLLDRTIGR